MTDLTPPTSDDLKVFLDLPAIDATRADMMLDLALKQCGVYLSPLPDTALGLVLTVAGRAYSNPQGVTAETVGPYSVQRPAAGVYLTRGERTSLKTMSGRGGAFTVDPTPADAGTGLPAQDLNVTWLDGVPLLDQQST